MADHLFQNINHSFSLSDIEFLTNLPGPNSCFQGPIEFPNDDYFFSQSSQGPGDLDNNFPGLFTIPDEVEILTSFAKPAILNDIDCKDRKRKTTDNDTITAPGNSSAFSSTQSSCNGTRKTNRVGRGKKAKAAGGREDEKPRDVVHVRAKRGQATNSHSLAERDRRRKINERLRCLQDIVPGCYKSMGMTVMLDEIINYVQSLQSQVEFLSTRLAVASTFQDFNLDSDAIETMQRANAIEAMNVQNIAIQEFQSAQFATLNVNFGYGPRLPQDR